MEKAIVMRFDTNKRLGCQWFEPHSGIFDFGFRSF